MDIEYKNNNNNIESREFLIILNTYGMVTNKIEKEIIIWISKKILNFIIKIKENNADIIYEINNNIDNNEIKILIHFNKIDYINTIDKNNLIQIEKYKINDFIHPKILLDNLDNKHNFIKNINVCGIDEKLMKNLWWNMIGKNDGYMKYSSIQISGIDIDNIEMSTHFNITDNILNKRERSYNFGWDNYPY